MKNIIRIFFLCLLPILSWSQDLYQGDSLLLVPDSSDYAVRSYNEQKLAEFRSDADFDYVVQSAPGKSLWDRFWEFIGRIWNALFSVEASTWLGDINLGELIVYSVCLFVFGYALFKLFKLKAFKSFQKNKDKTFAGEFSEEDIHILDFESLIREALDNNHYRLAIRLVYLQSLKILADKDLILWEPGKTNHDYSYEINEQNLRADFDRLSFYFDYAWYGDFMVDQSHYSIVRDLFNDLKSRTNG